MKTQCRRWIAAITLATMLGSQFGIARSDAQPPTVDSTVSPIKHVVVIIGENRTFDHVYATYVPKRGETVANLLSRGIVNADGSPGPNADAAQQFTIGNINPVAYFINTNSLTNPEKAPYTPFLPTPQARGAPPRAAAAGAAAAAPDRPRARRAAGRRADILARPAPHAVAGAGARRSQAAHDRRERPDELHA